MDKVIVVLVGKSSVGKDTLLDYMVQHGFSRIVKHTTRPKRTNEIDGETYHFVTEDSFTTVNAQETSPFICVRDYNTELNGQHNTWYYGLHLAELRTDDDSVVIFDVAGAKEFTQYVNTNLVNTRVLVINLMLDDADRKNRAIARGSFCEIEWNRRLKDDEVKFSNKELKDLAPINIYTKDTSPDEIYKIILPFVEIMHTGK